MLHLTVRRVHFEDLEGHEFERLVFAYLLRTDDWISLEWHGQVGDDGGRDIWGVREKDVFPRGQKVCVACANFTTMTFKKFKDDLAKVLAGPNGKPDAYIAVCGGKVSAALRDKANALFHEHEIQSHEVWSGAEFEERLRQKAESLLKRFIGGEVFPDAPEDLRSFVARYTPESDDEILALMSGLFDRPAFYTPFQSESSIPAFKKAITDTIEALNTGLQRLRDGTEIRRIPSRHVLQSTETKAALGRIERLLAQLRAAFDAHIKSGGIRPCGCKNPNYAVFMVHPGAAEDMDRLRTEILDTFRQIYPPFDVRVGWGGQ